MRRKGSRQIFQANSALASEGWVTIASNKSVTFPMLRSALSFGFDKETSTVRCRTRRDGPGESQPQ